MKQPTGRDASIFTYRPKEISKEAWTWHCYHCDHPFGCIKINCAHLEDLMHRRALHLRDFHNIET